jgi:uncharacterized protein (TIGR02001 family)
MRLIALALASLALPNFVHAETEPRQSGVTVTGSLTFSSAYVSDGIEYSDGPVIQPYVELGFGGFYAGVWASNADETLLGADTEVDLYFGYRGEAGAFYYDIGYGYYILPGASDLNSDEILLSVVVGPSETLSVTAGLGYADETDILDKSLSVEYLGLNKGVALTASFGDNESWRYWNIGASYALSEFFSADLSWQDTDIPDGKGLVVASLTYAF